MKKNKLDVGKEQKQFSLTRLSLSLLCIILGFNIGVYNAGFGIGYGVYLLFVTIGVLIAYPAAKRTPLVFALAAVSIVTGLSLGFRGNEFVQQFSLIISLSTIGLLFFLYSSPYAPKTIWDFFMTQLHWGMSLVLSPFKFIMLMNANTDEKDTKQGGVNPFRIIKTATISLVIFGIFAGLFVSADPIFKQMIDSLLKQAVGRIVWSIILAIFFGSLLSVVLSDRKESEPKLSFLSLQDIVVSMTILLILTGLFLFVQGKYLFASHEIFKQFNITYSQYVRKGFVELLVASGIAGILSYIIILKQRITNKPYLIWVTGALLSEIILLLMSAWKRNLMYIEVYGLTRMRIIGEVFLYWLAAVLVLLFILAVWRKFNERIMMGFIGIFTLCAWVYFIGVNMDMRIASVSPKREEMKDIFYLANLSTDAASVWEEIILTGESEFNKIKNKQELSDTEKSRLAMIKLAMYSLVAQREKLEKKYGAWDGVKKTYRDEVQVKPYENPERYAMNGNFRRMNVEEMNAWFEKHRTWQASTVSERKAYELLEQKRSMFFNRVDVLLMMISVFQQSRRLDLYGQEYWILHDFSYPFIELKPSYIPMHEQNAPTPSPMQQPISPSIIPFQ